MSTAHDWQLHQRNFELPKYSNLEAFLASHCVALETSESCLQSTNVTQKISSNPRSHMISAASKKALIATGSNRPCSCCKEIHKIYDCKKFKKCTISERLDVVKDNRLCFFLVWLRSTPLITVSRVIRARNVIRNIIQYCILKKFRKSISYKERLQVRYL